MVSKDSSSVQWQHLWQLGISGTNTWPAGLRFWGFPQAAQKAPLSKMIFSEILWTGALFRERLLSQFRLYIWKGRWPFPPVSLKSCDFGKVYGWLVNATRAQNLGNPFSIWNLMISHHVCTLSNLKTIKNSMGRALTSIWLPELLTVWDAVRELDLQRLWTVELHDSSPAVSITSQKGPTTAKNWEVSVGIVTL